MSRKRVKRVQRLRRGVVAVYLAISLTVLLGMGALAIDVGALYQAQAELQRNADAAALAAASRLVAEGVDDHESAAKEAAEEIVGMNKVLGETPEMNLGTDVEFGRALPDAMTGRYTFQPGGDHYDAVRVTVRRDVDLMFSRFLGDHQRGLEAQAAAVLMPRDIAVVIDLSNSMNYDSQLRFWDRSDGGYCNARDIWAALDGAEPSRPYYPGSENETEYACDTGPEIGIMSEWGDALFPGSYNASNDPGLYYIPRYGQCTDARIRASLENRGYSDSEISSLMGFNYDGSSSHWQYRVGVCLGLATWHSGKYGGLDPYHGDGDGYVESGELDWIPKPEFRVDWAWSSGFINWVGNSSYMRYTVPEFRYRYGLKTFTNFLLDSEPSLHETNNLWATPQQPLRAVKDAVQTMMDVIDNLESLDHVSLEIFASTARHEVNMSDDLYAVPEVLYERQSGHYDRATNIGGGVARAIAELTSTRARPNAHKVILLMSDGQANIDENGNSSTSGARAYAKAQAELAADLGYQIYTISVGYGVDRVLMQEIAAIGKGQEFYAVGSPEEYTQQLEDIFRALGGKRPVALIE